MPCSAVLNVAGFPSTMWRAFPDVAAIEMVSVFSMSAIFRLNADRSIWLTISSAALPTPEMSFKQWKRGLSKLFIIVGLAVRHEFITLPIFQP